MNMLSGDSVKVIYNYTLTLYYKKYQANYNDSITYLSESGNFTKGFHATIYGARDPLTCSGETLEDLARSFRDVIWCYEELCAKHGYAPYKEPLYVTITIWSMIIWGACAHVVAIIYYAMEDSSSSSISTVFDFSMFINWIWLIGALMMLWAYAMLWKGLPSVLKKKNVDSSQYPMLKNLNA